VSSSDFLIRSLTSDANGVCEIGVPGYGVEILDGGNFERANLIELGREDREYDASFAGDNVLACNPGARIAGKFDKLKLIVPNAALPDTVKVLIVTTPEVGWSADNPAGKGRVKWLTRGRTTGLAVGAATMIYDSGTLGEPDRFSTQETFEVFNYWAGYIACRRTFTTYVQVRPYNIPGATFQVLQIFSSKNYNTLPAYTGTFPTGAGYVMNWTTETAGGLGVLARYPLGQVQIFVGNDDANATSIQWVIGVESQ
jgi:hypothetical protein